MKRLLVVAAACLPLVACGSSGRSLRQPRPNQSLSIVTTSTPTTVANETKIGTAAPGPTTSAAASAFALTLPWDNGGAIDPAYTCKGAGERPVVKWTNAPANTKEIALVVTDDNAGGFVHWIVAGLDPAAKQVAAGALPGAAIEGANSFESVGWKAPCPPAGSSHTYRFRLYALSAPSGVTATMAADEAIIAIRKNIVSLVTRTGIAGA